MSGMLLLWPGYVYWARGQIKQAVAAFQSAVSKLECDGDPIALGWCNWMCMASYM